MGREEHRWKDFGGEKWKINKRYATCCVALRATRDQHDLKEIVYRQMSEDNEIVTLFYENGRKQFVNVSMDSGVAMIRDILRGV